MRTSEDYPSAPLGLQRDSVTNSTISIKFNKPEKENGKLTHFQVEYVFKAHSGCEANMQNALNIKKVKNVAITENKLSYSTTLESLEYFWNYTLRVRMATSVGFGNYSDPISIRTKPAVPNPVSELDLKVTSSRGVELRWSPPCYSNGIIVNYRIIASNHNNSLSTTYNTNQSGTVFTTQNLLPYCYYSFNISAEVNSVLELSDPTTSETVRTFSEPPKPAREFRPYNKTSSSVSLNWKLPEIKTGPTSYNVTATDKETKEIVSFCTKEGYSNTRCTVSNLDSYWNYSISLSVITEPFNASTVHLDHIQTAMSAPGPLTNVKVIQESNVTATRKVYITWDPPSTRDLNGIIQNYFVRYTDSSNFKKEFKYPSSKRKAVIDVIPERKYTFQIFAKTNANTSERDFCNFTEKIKAGAPIPIHLLPGEHVISKGSSSQVSNDEKQLKVLLNKRFLCDNQNGIPVKWYIIVAKHFKGISVPFHGSKEDYVDMIKRKKIYKTWRDVYKNEDNNLYVATQSWSPKCTTDIKQPESFTVGSEGECDNKGQYCNGYLEPDTDYRVRFTVCTNGGCLESEFSASIATEPNPVPLIAGSVSGVAAAIIVLVIVLIYLRRNRKGPFSKGKSTDPGQENQGFSTTVEMESVSKPRPIKIAEFASHVQDMHADSNLEFSHEYKLIKETCATHSTKAAEIQVNRIKNRYTNILSYDHSRVKLLPTEDDEGSDYINANYIPGFSSPREYIATQGPLPFTRDDFWRMIWEQNVSIIVMLTQLVERGRRKCDIYWPETTREPVYYGDLVVEIESESTLPDYVLRVMSVKLGDRARKVKQLHYLKWPDMGCPETTWLLLNFVGATRLYLPHNDPGPIVVHCSAGVGRTGTFIAVDYLMQQVSSSDVIDIYDYVMKMRNNRPNMVQTEDQYIFIHDCIKDFVNRSDEDSDDENEEGQVDHENPIYANM
ncbi:tyrosine-protein phosphatase 10D-like isoform X2 [Saccostrea cucullata]|uniref:tyrosine-protein phosphatase 10D-like isoform X2 n=1 Tax=Saccostrea cuccullata TaxID=36930 RepID=UPI002ED62EE4